MFGIGWTEFIVIAFVLLIFVGPRQLPAMFKKVGQIIGELKAASRELKNQVSSEVSEIEEELREASPANLRNDFKQELDVEVDSPYDAIHRGEAALKRGEAALKKEIQSLKESVVQEDDAPTPAGNDGTSPDDAGDDGTSPGATGGDGPSRNDAGRKAP